jgi:hypothetical protein
MFPNIKRIKSQTMNHMKYIYDKNHKNISEMTKFNHRMLKNQFPHNFLQNMMFNQIK